MLTEILLLNVSISLIYVILIDVLLCNLHLCALTMAVIEHMKRKGQSQAGIQQFLAKRVSLPGAENEQGESSRRVRGWSRAGHLQSLFIMSEII